MNYWCRKYYTGTKEEIMRGLKATIVTAILILAAATIAQAQFAQPDGAAVSAGTPETKTNTSAEFVPAQGGNITTVDISGETQTQRWQGFYGNVSGNLTLTDASGDRLFAWDLINVAGEVFASLNQTVDWTTISGVTDCHTDEEITGTGNDRVNETYIRNTTVSFDVAGTTITDACQTFTYVSSSPQAKDFEAVILNATTANNTVYAARINSSTVSFDGGLNDYQLMVPANSTPLTYWFYVEFN